MSWKIIKKVEKENELNLFFKENTLLSFYSSLEFQNIMKSKSWKSEIIIYEKEKKILCLANLFIKKKFKINFIYVPGGIEGEYNKIIFQNLKKYLKKKYGYLFIIFINLHNLKKNISFNLLTLIRVFNFHEANMVMKKNLDININNLYETYTKNWRHNLRRSFKFDNVVLKKNLSPDYDEMLNLYKEMAKLKKFKSYITKDLLISYFNEFGENMINIEARIDNKLIAFRSVIYLNDTAWDLFACSNLNSKKNYTTYKILNEIILFLISKKIKILDLSGVDKKNNIGVYNFKKGSGAQEFIKKGEYIYSPFFLFSILCSFAITLKRVLIK